MLESDRLHCVSKLSIFNGITFTALSAMLLTPTVTTAQPTVTDPNIIISEHVTGLSLPTGLRFINNNANELFIIEKDSGRVRRSLNGTLTTALDLNVATESERGLLGIELDPSFTTNGFVYLYYSLSNTGDSASPGAWVENRLSRFTYNPGTGTINPLSELRLAQFGTSTDGQNRGPNHDGGPLRVGPDGKLFGITGDLNRNGIEQNNQSTTTSATVGGVYRLNFDGTVPADNPFTSQSNTNLHRWYAIGVRNSFGIAFDPVTGALWDTENGPNTYDEINRVDRGFNSGWLDIMGPDSRDPQGIADLVNIGTYSDPEFSFLSPVGITGIEFLHGSALGPSYNDAVIVSDNNNGNLYLFRLNANRDGFVLTGNLTDLVADNLTERNSVRFGRDFGALTELFIGPDNALYATGLGEGVIYRLALIPEPGTLLITAALGGLCLLRRRAYV